MSLAEETRAAVRANPALLDALRAGVLNYAAAARWLELDADPDAVATALRRFEDRLADPDRGERGARVRMTRVDDEGGPIDVGGASFAPADDGAYTAVVATGAVDTHALEHVLGVLRANDVTTEAAAVTADTLCVIVPRQAGANAVRVVESALADCPVSNGHDES